MLYKYLTLVKFNLFNYCSIHFQFRKKKHFLDYYNSLSHLSAVSDIRKRERKQKNVRKVDGTF